MACTLPAELNYIDVDVDIEISSPLNGNQGNWPRIAARRKREREAVLDALIGIQPPTWSTYYVTLERIAMRPMDADNVSAGFKSIRDEVSRFLGLDDADPRIHWHYRQRIQRVRDASVVGKLKWKSYCRVVIAPDAAFASRESPDFEPRKVETTSKSSRPRVPDIARGTLQQEIELPIRARTSRLGIALLINPHDSSGLMKGDYYLRIAINWNLKNGDPWRSQGVTVRVDEVERVCDALISLRDRARVLKGGGG